MLVPSLLRTLSRIAALAVVATGLSASLASAADASLAGTHWRLIAVDGVAADASRREPFILLDSAGRFSGGTGCNRFAGGYVIDGDYLTFGQPATTRMYCASVWRQEKAILAALDHVARWQVKDGRLELYGGNRTGARRLPGGAGRQLSPPLRPPASPSTPSSRS